MGRASNRILFVFISVCLAAIIHGQTLPFRNYTEKNGLPATSVQCIQQDSRGFLWFGTVNGASRFDGLEFKNFKIEDHLPDSQIETITEDSSGNIWIGTFHGGVCRFSKGNFTCFSTKNGLPGDCVRAIAEDHNGVIWLGTNLGLCRFSNNTFTPVKVARVHGPLYITDIAITNDNTLWIASTNGLYRYTNQEFTRFTKENGLTDNRVLCLLQDSKGILWIGSEKGLTCCQKGKLSICTPQPDLGTVYVKTLMEDNSGNIWIGTRQGIYVLSGNTYRNYTTQHGLPSNFIYDVLQDTEGNTWIATAGGVGSLHSLNIETFSQKDKLPDNVVYTIIEDRKGNHWIGTGGGLCRHSNNKFTAFTEKNGLVNNTVNRLLEDRSGHIWIATVEGLSIMHPEATDKTGPALFSNHTVENGLSSNILFTLEEDSNGTIWIGTKKGITCGKNHHVFPPPFTTPNIEVLAILEDHKKNIWFSSDMGLYKYSPIEKKTTHFIKDDGLPGNQIYFLFEDSQRKLWIGTDNGLSCLYKGVFVNYSTRDGLPDNLCNFIIEDSANNLLIGTQKGMAHFNGLTFEAYTVLGNGPPTAWYTGLNDRNGTIWFGNAFGLTRITPSAFNANAIPPPVYITGVKVLEKNVPLDEIASLPYNRNYLRFDFTGLSFNAPESVTYKYRMEGIDTTWQHTAERSVYYPYLPHNKYRFTVLAINNGGIESKIPAVVEFAILPPFWKTWWFQTLLLLVFLSIVAAFVFLRIKRAKEKMELEMKEVMLAAKNRQLVMAQKMELMGILAGGAVHDMRNLLTVIINYSGLAAQDNEKRSKAIEKIQKAATSAVQLSRQILAFTRQNQDETERVNLPDLLEDIIGILTITVPEEITISLDNAEEMIRIVMNATHFQQVVMNLCLNAVQAMPEGGTLSIVLRRKDADVVLEIADTGTGIDTAHLDQIFEPLYTTKEYGKGSGLGLFVVKQIVEEYNGRIDVSSPQGEGTIFTITFPYNTGSPEEHPN